MGDHSLANVSLRPHIAVNKRAQTKDAGAVARISHLDTTLRGAEVQDRVLVKELEERRAEIGVLSIRLRDMRARRLPSGLDQDAIRRELEEWMTMISGLESSLREKIHAFEENLRHAHVLRDDLRRRRISAQRECVSLLSTLSGATRRACEGLMTAGETPIVAALCDGACSACGSAVSVESRPGGGGEMLCCPECGRFVADPGDPSWAADS